MLVEYFSAANNCWSAWAFTAGNRRQLYHLSSSWAWWDLTSPASLCCTSLSSPSAYMVYFFSAWCLSPAPLLLSCQAINHKCIYIGILLGPASLHATNVAAHESGWLEKVDVPPVALSWQAESRCPCPQESICFQCPDGRMFLSIANLCKNVIHSKYQPCYPKANSKPLLCTSGQVKNIFSPLAMTCKFSLRLSVLTVR